MPVTVAHVVGARPNDERMSKVFLKDLELPEPDVNLGVGSGSHATQTAALLEELEGVVSEQQPECVVAYGDVNSTLAAALGYVDFLSLVAGATLVVTDSGGVQEETTIVDVPCLTVRPNTERPITITHGTNRLVAPASLADAADDVLELVELR